MNKISTFLFVSLLSFTYSYAQSTFQMMPNQAPDNILSLVIDKTTNDIYVNSSTGIKRSTDNGKTWLKVKGIAGIGANCLYASDKGDIYCGLDQTVASPNSGVLKYDKNNNSWTTLNAPLNVVSLIEDKNGNLIAATGSTGNNIPKPLMMGNGIFSYNGSTWTDISQGLSFLDAGTYLPYTRSLIKDANQDIYVASYGKGVFKYQNSTWTAINNNLTDLNVSVIYYHKASNTIYAGTDSGIYKYESNSWVKSSNALPNKTVRSIVADNDGNIYAGLGFYNFQDGGLEGQIFYSSDNAQSWQDCTNNFASSDVLDLEFDENNNRIFACANGVWASSSKNKDYQWSLISDSTFPSVPIYQIAKNSKGHLFLIASNQAKYFGFGGLFRSTDHGRSWQQKLKGINRHHLSTLLVDSKDNVWVSGISFKNGASNGSFYNGELYKSTDNGENFVKNNSILTPTLRFSKMIDANGTLYISNGWGGPSNISSCSDYENWDNSLNSQDNGGMAFGCDYNNENYIFVGTETRGVMRSKTGKAGTFVPITNKGPLGNSSCVVDKFTGDMLVGGGNQDGPKRIFASNAPDYGDNLFELNLPDYSSMSNAIFDKSGNVYISVQSGNPSDVGLYWAKRPLSKDTKFTRLITVNNLSYSFQDFMIDDCANIYASNSTGGGLYKSNSPVALPNAPKLVAPSNNANLDNTNIDFSWKFDCLADSMQLQFAETSTFDQILYNQYVKSSNIFTNKYSFQNNKTYFWRVLAINSLGMGQWSETFSFNVKSSNEIDQEPQSNSIFKISPNPSSDYFRLDLTNSNIDNSDLQNIRFELVNMMGQNVLSQAIHTNNAEQNIIDIRAIPSGIYTGVIKFQNHLVKSKIMIVR